jgi:hypothetical protein
MNTYVKHNKMNKRQYFCELIVWLSYFMDNVIISFALLFELLVLILIYIPALQWTVIGLHPLIFLCSIPFVLLMLVYDTV